MPSFQYSFLPVWVVFSELLPLVPEITEILAGREIGRQFKKKQKQIKTHITVFLSLRTCYIWGEQAKFPDDHFGYSVFEPWCQASIEARGTGLEQCPLSHCQVVGLIHFLSHALVLPLHRELRGGKNAPLCLSAAFSFPSSLIYPLISRGSSVCGPL